MVPSRRRIQMTHENAVSMAALAQDDECGQADPSLRNLSGLQRSVRGSEATELAVRGHAQRTPRRAFQPCCGPPFSVSTDSAGDGRDPFITRATSTAASPRRGADDGRRPAAAGRKEVSTMPKPMYVRFELPKELVDKTYQAVELASESG